MTTTLPFRAELAPPTQVLPLTSVWCRNGLCPYLLAKHKPIMVGRIYKRAELRCPSCKNVTVYEVA